MAFWGATVEVWKRGHGNYWIGDGKPKGEDKRCGSGDHAQSDVVVRNVGGGKRGAEA